MRNILLVGLAVLTLGGCSSVGSLGIIAKSSTDVASMLRNGRNFKEIGPAQGTACRFFLLAIFPGGDADIETATNRALASVGGGDALINVTTQNSLYGFVPIYNVWSQSCTTVKGMAIRFEKSKEAEEDHLPTAPPFAPR